MQDEAEGSKMTRQRLQCKTLSVATKCQGWRGGERLKVFKVDHVD